MAAKKKPATKQPAGKKATAKQKPAAAKQHVGKKGSLAVETGGARRKIDELIASLDDWRGERMAAIRRLVHEVDPDVLEEWKWKGTPVWSHEGMVLNANAFKDKVKITFHHGAQLEDGEQLFNNGLDGNKWRAIDLYEYDALREDAFKLLLREAMAYNRTHAVPKSRGSNA